jgi:serine phosphatase RsbU (regulator of sigma subunit)
MLRALGYACYGFAVLDLATYWLGIADITGVSWSPFAAAVVGSVLVKAGDQTPVDSAATQAPVIRER